VRNEPSEKAEDAEMFLDRGKGAREREARSRKRQAQAQGRRGGRGRGEWTWEAEPAGAVRAEGVAGSGNDLCFYC
jgi:hypothetical protein